MLDLDNWIEYDTHQKGICQPIVEEEHYDGNGTTRHGVGAILVSNRSRRVFTNTRGLSVVDVGNRQSV